MAVEHPSGRQSPANQRFDPKDRVSFLRWAGSKRRVLHRLLPYWKDDFESYIEPFAGSSSLFFKIQPGRAVLGDINPELVNTLRAVRNRPAEVAQQLPNPKPSKIKYLQLRGLDPKKMRSAERAARFIYLNRFCFNGLYRTNKEGHFNVPYSHSRTGPLPTLEELKYFSRLLKHATIEKSDFQTLILTHATKNSFVYLDPPYATGNRRIFREYGSDSFNLSDIDRLLETLNYIHSIGAYFLLSYAQCSDVTKRFSQWRLSRYHVPRNISGFAHSRRKAVEVLVTNIE